MNNHIKDNENLFQKKKKQKQDPKTLNWWSGARPMGEQWWGLGQMSITSELGHLAVPINFLD